jgi:tetratricopeptide (TPR) repeat protein
VIEVDVVLSPESAQRVTQLSGLKVIARFKASNSLIERVTSMTDFVEQKEIETSFKASTAALKKSIEVAGDDFDFFESAGYTLLDMKYWRGASAMLLRAVEISQAEGDIDIYLMDAFHESVYKSAKLPDKTHNIPSERIGKIDEAILLVAEARYSYYRGNQDTAIELLHDAKGVDPNFPETFLLQAEMHAQNKDFEKAHQVLDLLWNFEVLPNWIIVEAETLESQIP